MRVMLAAIHMNESADMKRVYREDGEKRLTIYFSKAKKAEPSVRQEMTPATHSKTVCHSICQTIVPVFVKYILHRQVC